MPNRRLTRSERHEAYHAEERRNERQERRQCRHQPEWMNKLTLNPALIFSEGLLQYRPYDLNSRDNTTYYVFDYTDGLWPNESAFRNHQGNNLLICAADHLNYALLRKNMANIQNTLEIFTAIKDQVGGSTVTNNAGQTALDALMPAFQNILKRKDKNLFSMLLANDGIKRVLKKDKSNNALVKCIRDMKSMLGDDYRYFKDTHDIAVDRNESCRNRRTTAVSTVVALKNPIEKAFGGTANHSGNPAFFAPALPKQEEDTRCAYSVHPGELH